MSVHRVSISGARWTIRVASRATVEAAFHDGRGCPKGRDGCVDGWTDFDARTVWIVEELEPDVALETVLHEWAHVTHPKEKRHRRIYEMGRSSARLLRELGFGKLPPPG